MEMRGLHQASTVLRRLSLQQTHQRAFRVGRLMDSHVSTVLSTVRHNNLHTPPSEYYHMIPTVVHACSCDDHLVQRHSDYLSCRSIYRCYREPAGFSMAVKIKPRNYPDHHRTPLGIVAKRDLLLFHAFIVSK